MHRSSTNSFAKTWAGVRTYMGWTWRGARRPREEPRRRGGRARRCRSRRSGRSGGDLGGVAVDVADGRAARLARARCAADARHHEAHMVASALDLESEARWWRRHSIWLWLARGAATQGENGLGFCSPAWDGVSRTVMKTKFHFGGELSHAHFCSPTLLVAHGSCMRYGYYSLSVAYIMTHTLRIMWGMPVF
jgi:hypothetical protein